MSTPNGLSPLTSVPSFRDRRQLDFSPAQLRAAFQPPVGIFLQLMKKTVMATMESVCQLMHNRGEDEALIQRVRIYHRDKYMQKWKALATTKVRD